MHETFRPLAGASNPHLQTLLPRLVRRHVQLSPYWQRLELPDGDFIDLAWSENPELAREKPRVCSSTVWKGIFTALMPTVCYAPGKLQAGWVW
ncbi:hypothetical protein L326_0122600 [Yersinia pestis 113]|nr:hypothetical protein L326_0122600 [Yersinia pestis 113]ETO50245.1 hypothetical protein L328_0123730 [Yersinia pestis 24H]